MNLRAKMIDLLLIDSHKTRGNFSGLIKHDVTIIHRERAKAKKLDKHARAPKTEATTTTTTTTSN